MTILWILRENIYLFKI